MFIAQPPSSFGSQICEELNSEVASQPRWQSFEFAAAWVNLRGADCIEDSARNFLAAGGRIRATVGLDFGSTTYEGLGRLLDLECETADITTNVFFDENRACTFHPKVFLFSNEMQARLFVGSNNMTGAGLNTNVEVTLGVTAALDDETIRTARETLANWRDVSNDSRTRLLTREFLEELRARRYVCTERELSNRRRSEAGTRVSRGEPLFGRSAVHAGGATPATGGGETSDTRTSSSAFGDVLLMRVRKRRNGNQVQISMRVLQGFMNDTREVVSTDGILREIGSNSARGGQNTTRFEAPEMGNMANPVARFQWIDAGDAGSEGERVLQYELFDADNNEEGARILERLQNGIADPPATNLNLLSQEETVLSKAAQTNAQWYRLD